MNLKFGLIPLVSLFLISCKKDKNCELNEENLVGNYKVKSVVFKSSPSDPGIDYYLSWDNCKKDDIQRFTGAHVIVYEDAGVLCYPGGTTTGTWALSGNVIALNGQSGTVTFFNCRNTVITFPGSVPGETTTLSLVRQ